MVKHCLKIFIFSLVIAIFVFLSPETELNASVSLEVCESIDSVDKECQKLSASQCRQLLEDCQNYLEEKSAQIEQDIAKTEREKKTLQDQIYLLNSKITNYSYQIYQSNIVIKDLNLQIGDTQGSIDETSSKIGESSGNLIFVLRTMYEEEQKSLVEIFLSEECFSDFFDDLVALEALSSKSKDLLQNIKGLKDFLEDQRNQLDGEKQDLESLVAIQGVQKQESEKTKDEREYYLGLTEAQYQEHLQEKEENTKKTADIMARIYKLIGVREDVTYEEAIEIAKYAANLIGIRPALLLGILSQESNIGKNVGQCFLKDPKTGAGVRASTGAALNRVMNPTRDVPYFLNVIDALNKEGNLKLDPYETLVSCPMSIGWGGAMGPAQFIPSTWVAAGYESRVEKITGSAADPWDIRDASLASALYLKDGINRYGTEGKAIQTYFCGSPRGDYWCNWYEESVLRLASCHQNFLDTGSMSSSCENLIF